jgi:hypothetical protein
MWKLILLIELMRYSFSLEEPQIAFIVIDDCILWEKTSYPKRFPEEFSFVKKEFKNNHWLMISYSWLDQTDKPINLKSTLRELSKQKLKYSSSLEYDDWARMEIESSKKTLKVYVLTPSDFCSQKRFEFDHQFELYEVFLILSKDE